MWPLLALVIALPLFTGALDPGGCFLQPAYAAGSNVLPGPALGVTMLRADSDDRPLIAAGQNLTISIGVNNLRGGSAAHDAVLKVSLPYELKLTQASMPPTSANGGELKWKLGTISAGAFPQIIELTLASSSAVRAGTKLSVEAAVTVSDHDADIRNSRSAFTAIVGYPAAALALLSDLAATPLTLDHPAKFSVEVMNLGTLNAAGSALTLTLPPMVSLKAGDPPPALSNGNSITWQLGSITANASRTVTATITADLRLSQRISEIGPANRLKFKLDASTSTVPADSSRNHLDIGKRVELFGSNVKVWLSVQGADRPGELPIGRDVIYTILYGNFGNAVARKAVVTLGLPEGLTLLHAEPPPSAARASDKSGTKVHSWDAGDLPVGLSNSIKCDVHVVDVPEGGSLVTAMILSSGPNVSSGENVARSLRYAQRVAQFKTVNASSHRLYHLFELIALIAIGWLVFQGLRRSQVDRGRAQSQ